MANTLQQQVQQLKLLIEQARQHTNHDTIVEMMRAQYEKEKNEVCCMFDYIRYLNHCLSVFLWFSYNMVIINRNYWCCLQKVEFFYVTKFYEGIEAPR
jgi:hypothetical protein